MGVTEDYIGTIVTTALMKLQQQQALIDQQTQNITKLKDEIEQLKKKEIK